MVNEGVKGGRDGGKEGAEGENVKGGDDEKRGKGHRGDGDVLHGGKGRGGSEIGKGERERDVDRILGRLQSGNCYWQGSHRKRYWQWTKKEDAVMSKAKKERKCPFC